MSFKFVIVIAFMALSGPAILMSCTKPVPCVKSNQDQERNEMYKTITDLLQQVSNDAKQRTFNSGGDQHGSTRIGNFVHPRIDGLGTGQLYRQ